MKSLVQVGLTVGATSWAGVPPRRGLDDLSIESAQVVVLTVSPIRSRHRPKISSISALPFSTGLAERDRCEVLDLGVPKRDDIRAQIASSDSREQDRLPSKSELLKHCGGRTSDAAGSTSNR
jgi:hypothetical protein